MEKQFKNKFDEYMASDEYREYLDTLEKCQAEYEIKAKETFESLEYDQRMYVAFHLYFQLYENEFIDQGSYRHLIYTKLGFSTDSYSILMDSGLMYVHNSVYPHDDITDGIVGIFKLLEIDYNDKLVQKAYRVFCYGSLYEPSKQLKFDFEEE
jgi:hypothetical protein